ncbi:hypothetical protein [Marinicrinis sediminis]|uniref:Uncharacterized protein n=1 Tax=Marinicrinis sediminis TaxID=1652465 RepID=A0ABW5R6G3_9BACL
MLLIWIFIFVIGMSLLYANREKQEEMLALKLIGYYLLGSFHVNLDGLILPVGFLISLLLRPRDNRAIKMGAAIFGLILMILGFL